MLAPGRATTNGAGKRGPTLPTIARLPYSFDGRRVTDRLVLRLFVEDDFAALYRMQSDDEVTRWLLWGARSPDEVRAALARKLTDGTLAADGDGLSLAVELRETGETIGDAVIILRSVDNQQGEVGYIIHPDHQGRGYATETTVALLDIAFDEIELHRVCGRFEPRNVASGRVLERAGMRREATLIENEWIRGEWQSEGICAVLRSEWPERRPR